MGNLPSGFATNPPALYTGSITVTVTSPQRIDLTLRVIDTPFYNVYLPLIQR